MRLGAVWDNFHIQPASCATNIVGARFPRPKQINLREFAWHGRVFRSKTLNLFRIGQGGNLYLTPYDKCDQLSG